jgi:hypothetical protein
VAGLVGGLAGSAKKAQEAARQMEAARSAWESSLEAFGRALEDRSAWDRAGDDMRAQFEALGRDLAARYNVTITDASSFFGRTSAEFAAMAANAGRKTREFYEEMARLAGTMEENQKKLEEARRAEMARTERELDGRLLRARGMEEEGQAIARQLAREEELRRAREAGWSDEMLALLELIHVEEDLARVRSEAASAARREEEEVRAAARQAHEGQLFMLDLLAREADLADNALEVIRVRMEMQTAQEVRRAEELLAAGTITEELFARLIEILDGEMTRALEDFAAGVEAAAAATIRAMDRMSESLDLRELVLEGREAEAALLRLEFQQRRELEEAIAQGLGDDVIDRLRRVQDAERDALRLRQMEVGQVATIDSGSAAIAGGSTPGDVVRDAVRRVAGITEVQAFRIEDYLRSIMIHTRETATNTRGGRGPGEAVGDGAARPVAGAGIVSLRPTINFYGPVSDPETAGEMVGAAMVRSLQRSLGNELTADRQAAGDATRN